MKIFIWNHSGFSDGSIVVFNICKDRPKAVSNNDDILVWAYWAPPDNNMMEISHIYLEYFIVSTMWFCIWMQLWCRGRKIENELDLKSDALGSISS